LFLPSPEALLVDVVLIVVVVIDGFTVVPIRFDAPANIFPKISRAAGIGRANWEFVETVWRKGNRLRSQRVVISPFQNYDFAHNFR
jgi:hypothetical protein